MTKLLTISLTAFALFALFSCSDDETPNTNTDAEYYPMTTGSYWVYESKELDGEGKVTATTTDSVAISKTTTKLGKECFEFKNYEGDDHDGNTYQYKTETELYTLIDVILPDPEELPLPYIDEQWVKIADENQSSWAIFELALNDFEIEIEGVKGKLTGTLKITGRKGGMVSLSGIMGQSYNTQEFTIENHIVGTFKEASVGLTGTIDEKINVRYYYADNVGLVKYRSEPLLAKIKTAFNTIQVPISGREEILLRTNVTVK
ncbi:MAG: hypothetical protein CVV22_11265 [Ignavibacteriae bacterium HGW-Ignavibacteriae-1]|jgi:hypothetical protein|nr:MAG: hypothetical protein CVV22_11265 [Ignavibacteriae bacterium HGW-Ignavibacteriae-1]